jgi:deferrochelatase/peroxidase EfeB
LENGKELKIVRDNMPFGRVGEKEFGTTSLATRARRE